MLDLNPLSPISTWIEKMAFDKWMKLFASCSLAAFIGFWGGFSITAGNVLAATGRIGLALAWGFVIGTGMMATAVLLTLQRLGMWKQLGITLPVEEEKILEGQDVVQTSKPATNSDAMKRSVE